jgi:xylan 1,4-beta-xylosidase
LHPDVYVVTSRHAPDALLQRAGHGDLVETQTGETYVVHLASRPIPGLRRSPLGRETAIQKAVWGDDGWLRLSGEKHVPRTEVEASALAPQPFPPEPERHSFTPAGLPAAFQWLRTPHAERIFSLTAREGFLRLYGRESIGSWYEQALVARRQTDLGYEAETEVEAEPKSLQQLAGLIAYYNRCAFHYLALGWDDAIGPCLQVYSCNGAWPLGALSLGLETPVPVPAGRPVRMKVEVRATALRFYFQDSSGAWSRIGPVLDASLLSDECGEGDHGNFTGAFVGMAAHDVSGLGMPADFSFFSYRAIAP